MNKKTKDFFLGTLPKYIFGIAIPLTVGALSALLTKDGMALYTDLAQPPLAPPAIVFPIVWSILYLLMGISSTTVFIKREFDVENAEQGLKFYLISLILNFIWSPVFFIRESFLLALVILGILTFTVIRTVCYYLKVSRLSAYLQIPYAVWCVYAAYLNFAVFILN